MANTLTAIIITKNEEQMVGDALVSVEFANEVIVADTGSTDATLSIAKDHEAKIIHSTATNYADFRNVPLDEAVGDWVLFVDADERVTPLLKKEILETIEEDRPETAYAIPRQNIFLGRPMSHGGWGNDYVIRLFKRDHLKRYVGELHEQPEFTGDLGTLKNYFVHFSHRDLSSMVRKTEFFTGFEATKRLEAGHPPVVWWRFIRVMASEFWLRFIKLEAGKDGTEGVIDGLFQVFNTFIIYARLWEAQSVPQPKKISGQ